MEAWAELGRPRLVDGNGTPPSTQQAFEKTGLSQDKRGFLKHPEVGGREALGWLDPAGLAT